MHLPQEKKSDCAAEIQLMLVLEALLIAAFDLASLWSSNSFAEYLFLQGIYLKY